MKKDRSTVLDYFFLDVYDEKNWDEYEQFVLGDEYAWAVPMHKLRMHEFAGYPKAKYPHFPDRINLDEETGIRWTWGSRWHENFPADGNRENRLPGLIYKVNSDDFHGEQFEKNPDMLTLGCSVSSGIGLPHNFSWPYILSHVYGRSVNNLGSPGQSAAFMAYLAMNHMIEYGHPKHIYFMVPPLDRYWGPTADFKKGWDPKERRWHSNIASYSAMNQYYVGVDGKPFFYTSLDNHKTILPLDVAVHLNLAMIEMLAMFCKGNGVELHISSWEKHTYRALRIIDYPDFVQPQFFLMRPRSQYDEFTHLTNENCYDNWGYPGEIGPLGSRANCRCGKSPQSELQDEFWDYGLDIKHDYFNPHPGLHMQIHLAELISGRKIEVNEYENIKPWFEGTKFEPTDFDKVQRPDRVK